MQTSKAKTRAGVRDGTRAGGCAEDGLLRASILKFKPRFENRCKVFPGNAFQRASILDFGARLANRCKVFPVYALLRASILKFKPRFENRCKVFPGNSPKAASILDFIHRLANQCSFLPGNASCTAVILDLRGSIWESLQHHRSCSEELPACSARRGNDLPHPILIFVAAKENGPPAAAVAATMSASDSILRCRKGEWFRLQ